MKAHFKNRTEASRDFCCCLAPDTAPALLLPCSWSSTALLLHCSFTTPPCYLLLPSAPASPAATSDLVLVRTFSFPAPAPELLPHRLAPSCTSLHLLAPPCSLVLPSSSFPSLVYLSCPFPDPVPCLLLTCSFLCPALLLPSYSPASAPAFVSSLSVPSNYFYSCLSLL